MSYNIVLSSLKALIINWPKVKNKPLFTFRDLIHCYKKYSISPYDYFLFSLYKHINNREDYIQNDDDLKSKLARQEWARLYRSDFVFLNKYTSLRYDINNESMKKRTIAYSLHYGIPQDAYIQNNVFITRAHYHSGTITAGKNLTLARGVDIDLTADITFGDDVMLSEGVKILTHGHDYRGRSKDDCVYGDSTLELSPIYIGDNAWLGARATILAGCKYIGKGAIIGSCSVVTHDVPDFAIVAGNPARIIKMRE